MRGQGCAADACGRACITRPSGGPDTIGSVTEQGQETTWNFPEGSVGHDESVKGYAVEATDGQVGTVSWASYAPGECYMVVSYHDGHDDAHHVVPASAVKLVDHERRAVGLTVTVAEVKATPKHEKPDAPVDWGYVSRFERGMLSGYVWPYTDV
ncbi:MAG: hypothetical protein ACRDL7_10990 [Gaiellaceae bacterium]